MSAYSSERVDDVQECSRAGCGRDPDVLLTWNREDEPRGYCEPHAIELGQLHPDHIQEDVDEVLEEGVDQ